MLYERGLNYMVQPSLVWMIRHEVQLELVIESDTNNGLVNLTDDGVAELKISAEVLVELIFQTGAYIQAHMILLVGTQAGSLYLGHRVVDTDERVEVELVVPQPQQVVSVEVHVPPVGVVVRKETVKTYFGTQLVQNTILETCTEAQTLDFSAINEISTDCGLSLMNLCLSKAHAQHQGAY